MLTAQIPDFQWAVQAGGADSLLFSCRMAIDPSGNLLITGHFKDVADVDPDPQETYYLTSAGEEDIFLLKLDSDGNFLWAFSMGDVNYDRGKDVTTDASGNVYLTGYFNGTMDVDPGDGEFFLSHPKSTAFVIKYGPSGNLVWARQMGSPDDPGFAYGLAIDLDNSQNVLVAGQFLGRVDFNPGSGIFDLQTTGYDGYIQKLDNNGNFIWVKQFVTSGTHYICDMELDPNGNIYTTGSFYGTTDFDPDPSKKSKYNITSYGISDIFYSKLDANGNFVWANHVGGSLGDYGYAIHVDPAGYVYGTGQFCGVGDFNPSTGVFTMIPIGESDLFIEKLSLDGNFIWAKQVTGPYYQSGHDILTDEDGNILLTGFFYETTDFDLDPATTYYLTTNGADDSFLAKYDPDGNLIWVSQTGGIEHDWGVDIELDPTGNIYVTGDFRETADFDPDANNEMNMTNTGGEDMFIQKFSPSGGNDCEVPSGLQATNITNSSADLGWNAINGATYNVRYREPEGTWTEIADVTGTTISIVELTMATVYEFQVRTTCYSNYSYSYEFVTAGGCTDIWEENNSLATAKTIPLNDNVYGLINPANDMDYFSFSTTNLEKNIMITLTDLPDNYNLYLYKSDGSLLASSANDGTADELIIYNSRKSGSYIVLVSGNAGAYDPVFCYTLNVSVSGTAYKSGEFPPGMAEDGESLSIFPNPAKDVLHIGFSVTATGLTRISIINVSGQTVYSKDYQTSAGSNHLEIPVNNLKPGLYIVRMSTTDKSYTQKIMINR